MTKPLQYYVNSKGDAVPFPKDRNIIIREDARVEKLCSHGVGHPLGHLRKWDEWMGVHGCDGCCYKAEFWL